MIDYRDFHVPEDSALIRTRQELLDIELVHDNIAHCYWARGIPRELCERSLRNSLCFGIYVEGSQVGFARVVTDLATFAYLGDVFIVEHAQGNGYGKQLMTAILSHPDLQGLRRFCLATRDAHSLYERYGFRVIQEPESWMEIKVADIYLRSPG